MTPTQRYQQALTLARDGQRDKALTVLRDLDHARPGTPEILFQIGRLEAADGKTERAEAALRQALKLRPREAAIWQALYLVLTGGARKKLEKEAARARITLGSEQDAAPILGRIEKGEAAQAEQAALALVKAAPEAFWPAYALGRARAVQGNWPGALPPLQVAHDRAPDHAGAEIALGEALARTGSVLRAEAHLSKHAETDPKAALTLARLYRETMRLNEALDLLTEWSRKRPRQRAVWSDLALTSALSGDAPRAMETAEKAAEGLRDPAPFFARLATAFEEAGDIPAAEAAVATGLAKAKAGRASLLTHRAQLMQSAGDIEGAEHVLTEALALDPHQVEALRATVAGRKVAADDPVLAQIDAALARPDTTGPNRSRLHFAAAKAAWDRKDMADAARHLEVANRLMATAYPYAFQADLEEARRLARDWHTLSAMQSDGPADPVLFVTGLPRSGTTLVETILSAHPNVAAGGEMPFLGRALAPAMDALRSHAPDPALFARAGERYFTAARRRTGAALFTDKAISTFTRVGHTLTALPGAKIVVLRRDPRDVGLSMYRNLFAEGLHRYTNDLDAMGRYIRLHDALVAFWAEALPKRVHIVEYEALTAEPEPHIRALVAFCGLDWDDACLAPERSERRIQTLSFAQARAPIGQQAVAGWKRFGDHLGPLIRALDTTDIDLTPEA